MRSRNEQREKEWIQRRHKSRTQVAKRKENTLWCWTCILKGKVWLRANVKNNKRMAKLRCEHKEAKNFLERANYDRERIWCVGALNEKRLLCDKCCCRGWCWCCCYNCCLGYFRFRRCLFNINSIKVNVLLINELQNTFTRFDCKLSYHTLLIISYWYWKESTGVKDNI